MAEEKEDIARIKFKFNIPENKLLSILSKKYPNFSFHILSMLPISKNQGNNIVNIEGKDVLSIISDLKKSFPNLAYTILFSSKLTLLINITMPEPFILENLVKIGIPLQYPVTISNGIANVSLVTERTKIDKFLTELEKISIDFSIKEIGNYRKTDILTAAQRNVLTKAYDDGYFEIPRKKSMTNLAKDLGIKTSSLSEMFRRIFKRLTQEFLGN
jgi:hypothetical protein